METTEPYEFSAAFRGDSYEWFPSEPPEAPQWQPLLVHCLRNQVAELVIEGTDGRRWLVAWTAKNRNQVRGGSLSIERVPERLAELAASLDPGSIMRTAVAALTGGTPWVLPRGVWLAITDPESDVARYFETVGLAVPGFSVHVEDATVRGQLEEVGGRVDFVVLGPGSRAASPAGQLFIEWFEGRGWLVERIGVPKLSSTELLAPAEQSATLGSLAQIVECSAAPVAGWDHVVRVLALFDDVAARWAGGEARWQGRSSRTAREPVVDAVAGTVEIPGDGEPRRARELAARLGIAPVVEEPAPKQEPAARNGAVVSVAVVAFAFGLVIGATAAYVWVVRFVCG